MAKGLDITKPLEPHVQDVPSLALIVMRSVIDASEAVCRSALFITEQESLQAAGGS